MAILNNDVYNYNGIELVNTYICVSSNVIRLYYDKNTLMYYIDIEYSIYGSISTRENGYSPISGILKRYIVDTLPSDIYNYAYDELKKIYTNYTDC
jgi:hypothetical protein